MAKFNLGDKVTVISKETCANHIGRYFMKDDENDISDVMTSSMKSYCGQMVTIKSYTSNGKYKIYEDNGMWTWTDEMFASKFSKSDLKNGMRIEFEDGTRCLLFDGKCLKFDTGRYWVDMSSYDDEFEDIKWGTSFKIVKIYNIPSNPNNILKGHELGELLWERSTKVILTPKQIADKFGISENDLVIKTKGETISEFQF